MTCHVQGESLLGAGRVAEGGAGVVIRALRLECHTAGDLCIRPDLALKGLDGEDLILEEHRVVLNCFANALVLSLQSGNRLLLGALPLELHLCLIV